MAKAIKTNVLRHLDALKIPYETREYTVDGTTISTGKLVAEKVDLPAEHDLSRRSCWSATRLPHLVAIIPVELELDLKAVARAAGCKSVHMLPQKDLLPLTGYLRGGCSPIGMKKAFPTFVDSAAQGLARVSVQRGRARVSGDSGGGCARRLHKSENSPTCAGAKVTFS